MIGVIVRNLQRGASGQQPQPDVPAAAGLGHKGHGLAVRRDRRRLLVTYEIGDPLKLHIPQRVRCRPEPEPHSGGDGGSEPGEGENNDSYGGQRRHRMRLHAIRTRREGATAQWEEAGPTATPSGLTSAAIRPFGPGP